MAIAIVVFMIFVEKEWCRNLAFNTAKILLRDALQKNASTGEIMLYGKSIPPTALLILSNITLGMSIPAFFSFLAVFLLEETSSCDPKLDCFLVDSKTFDPFLMNDLATALTLTSRMALLSAFNLPSTSSEAFLPWVVSLLLQLPSSTCTASE